MTNVDTIPEALRSVPQWVCWTERERGGKQTKVPLWPETGSFASVRDSGTWASFEEAMETARNEESIAGLGFVFTENDPFVGIDLDDCRDAETGDPESWAVEIIEQFDSFSEVSPSQTGYHVYVRGELPDGGNRSGNIECYEAARFFTVTGTHVSGTPMEINERSDALAHVHAEHIASPDPTSEENRSSSASSTTSSMDDEELLSRAMKAKNGPKFTRLWNGNTSGYDSQSEADMALACLLAFWAQKDAAQMDRLFRQSELYRGKWDDPHYSGGKTYGTGTVERAITVTSDVYEPSDQREAESVDSASACVGTSVRKSQTSSEDGTQRGNDDADRSEGHPSSEDIAAVDAAIAELVQVNKGLEAQHEYLYEALEAEQTYREQLEERVAELEEVIATNRRSLLDRLIG